MLVRARWWIVFAIAVFPLLGWWAYGLFDVDEGFYAAAVAEMNRRGEWITPFYNGAPWFEKPILLYWVSKPSVLLFGETVGPRLPSVLATVGTLLTIGWFAKRRFGEDASQRAILILGGSLLSVAIGRMMLTDPLLDLSLVLAFTTFWESIAPDSDSSITTRTRFRIATAACLGFGVLAKGPVSLILFALVAGWIYWRQPLLRPNFRGGWIRGTGVLVLIVASWYVPAYLANGQVFVQKFLIEQNIGRFTGGDPAHTLGGLASLAFYVPILILGLLPWSFWIPHALLGVLRDAQSGNENVACERYLVTWASVGFIFFTVSGAKLPHYILPAIPPLAMLIALRLNGRWSLPAAAAVCFLVACLADGAFVWWYGDQPLNLFGRSVQPSAQVELHAYARYLRSRQGSVALYQMSRRQRDRGTGTTQLQETSQPSFLYYFNGDVLDTDSFASILKSPAPVWIVTRSNRIQPEDFLAAEKAGLELQQVHVAIPEANYRLYRVQSAFTGPAVVTSPP